MLSPYRVIELSTVRTPLAGQILGDLGADVIAVEPPGGSTARRLGPFFQDVPDPDRSLFWWAYNRNKRSITLDLESADGRDLLRRLVKGADFLVEGFDPGYLEGLGLGYDALAAVNPGLIVASITPFGQDGPKAGYADSDLTVYAASSVLSAYGDRDRAPLRISVPQSYLHAGGDAAVGCLIAHFERVRSGRGQHVDISAQASVTMASQSYTLTGAWGDANLYRVGGGVQIGPLTLRFTYPCRDGYVSITFLFGTGIGPATRRLMEVVHDEGFCDEAMRDKDWIGYTMLLLSGQEPFSEVVRAMDCVEQFCRAHTKRELYDLAMQRGLLIAPASTVEDLVGSRQLGARGYWIEIEHPELGRSFTYPGPFVKLSETPIQIRRRPPLLGEHNDEIYRQELGLNPQEVGLLTSTGAV